MSLSLRSMASPTGRRRALVMADQGAASLSNVLVGVLVARALPAEGFGAFGLAWVAYLVAIGVGRAFVGEPLLSRYSHEREEQRMQRLPDVLGSAVTVSVVLSATGAVIALGLDGEPSSAMLAMCLVLPIVLLEDAWRFAFVIERPLSALVMDVTWLLTVVVALVSAPADAGAAWFVLAWGASAIPAVALAAVIDRVPLFPMHPFRWLRDERETGSRFFWEFLSAQACGHFSLIALGGVAGMTALAGVRAVQILYGPLNTVHAGIYLAVVPDGARTRDDPRRLRRLSVVASGVISAVALTWLTFCLLLSDGAGETLFGQSWWEGNDLILPMGLAMIAGSVVTGGFAGVRSLGDPRASLRARLQSLPGQLVLPLLGGAMAGAVGFTLGLLGAQVVSSVVWWRVLLSHEGTSGRPDAEAQPEAPLVEEMS